MVKKLVLGMVLVSSTVFAWDEQAGCGFRYSVEVCTPNGPEHEVSDMYPDRASCQAGLAKRRWNPRKGIVARGVHVVSPCDQARCVGEPGVKLKVKVEFNDWYDVFFQQSFTAQETCITSRDNLLNTPGFDTDVLINCVPFTP